MTSLPTSNRPWRRFGKQETDLRQRRQTETTLTEDSSWGFPKETTGVVIVTGLIRFKSSHRLIRTVDWNSWFGQAHCSDHAPMFPIDFYWFWILPFWDRFGATLRRAYLFEDTEVRSLFCFLLQKQLNYQFKFPHRQHIPQPKKRGKLSGNTDKLRRNTSHTGLHHMNG